MKPSWRETGRQLQKELLAEKQKMHLLRAARREEIGALLKPSYCYAGLQFLLGDPSLLAAYLRSDKPLNPRQRSELFDLIEGKLTLKRKRGRPRDNALHDAADTATLFYNDWKRRNEERGISSRGHGDAMKDEALRFVLEEFDPPSKFVDRGAARELMDRPRKRRQ